MGGNIMDHKSFTFLGFAEKGSSAAFVNGPYTFSGGDASGTTLYHAKYTDAFSVSTVFSDEIGSPVTAAASNAADQVLFCQDGMLKTADLTSLFDTDNGCNRGLAFSPVGWDVTNNPQAAEERGQTDCT